jgi:hypothetical protein
MKKPITFTQLLAAFLATTLQPVSADTLTIDLNQAVETLLKDSPWLCSESGDTTDCQLPRIEDGGVTVNEFINISSTNTAYLTRTTGITELALDASPGTNPLIADFTFDATRALVSQIGFDVGDPKILGCTVFELSGSSFDCSADASSTNPFVVSSTKSILGLRLYDTENYAYAFDVTYTAVPVPAAAILFLSGLAGLAGFTLRGKQTQLRT